MITKNEVADLLADYLVRSPGEKERCHPLLGFLKQHLDCELIDRKNFAGHITASAFIVDKNRQLLLLLKHKSLNRWLQPGGHVDATDPSLQASALREAGEETGLHANELTLVSNAIFDVDSHLIPENNRKHEPAHLHHDIRFLYKCSRINSLNISLEESTDSRWVSFAELEKNPDFAWVGEKVASFS